VAKQISTDDEVADYLRSLLQHRSGCDKEVCEICATLQGICELLKHRIFFGTVEEVHDSAATRCTGNELPPMAAAGSTGVVGVRTQDSPAADSKDHTL
jgi:hypothetical protein